MLAIAGCGRPAEQPASPSPEVVESKAAAPAVHKPALLLKGDGLVISDAAAARRSILFGGPASAALDAARQFHGDPENVAMLEECGAGPLQATRFAGVTLASQDGKFAGWWVDQREAAPRPATERGISIGSTREALEAAYSVESFESSLGQEFTADGLAGVIEGEGRLAKVSHLWAGATCIMR